MPRSILSNGPVMSRSGGTDHVEQSVDEIGQMGRETQLIVVMNGIRQLTHGIADLHNITVTLPSHIPQTCSFSLCLQYEAHRSKQP